MHPLNKAGRQRARYVKGIRRIREDRAEHGSDHSCPCFRPDGRTFDRFADTPAICSGPCCGNPRRWWGTPSIQEQRLAGRPTNRY
jgi:hypothetical protein